MTKLVKNYFLFFAAHPILYSFLPAILITLLVYFMKDGAPSLTAQETLVYLLVSILARTGIHAIIVYSVIIIFITRERFCLLDDSNGSRRYNDSRIRFIVTKDGLNMFYDKAIWGKGEKRYVIMPRYYGENNLEVFVTTNISGKYENSTMYVSVTIKLSLGCKFDRDEVITKLSKHYSSKKHCCLDDYFVSVFKKTNQRIQDKVSSITAEYALQNISEPEMLNELVNILVFPNKVFSNIANVKISVSSPFFSSYKKMRYEAVNN